MKSYQNMVIPGKDVVGDNPNDFYETPVHFVTAALQLIPLYALPENMLILDVGTGTGRWSDGARKRWPNARIHAVEINRDLPKPDSVDKIFYEDFRYWRPPLKYDVVIGNPPFGVSDGKRDGLLAETCVRNSYRLLKDDGWLAFLLKTVFVEGQDRGAGLFVDLKPTEMYQSTRRIPWRPDDYGSKSNSVAYAFFIWHKGSYPRFTQLRWFDWKDGELKRY